MFFANLDWSLALVSMLVVYHGKSKTTCQFVGSSSGNPGRLGDPEGCWGKNIGGYPLVMTNIAINKKNAHRNRWFPY